MKKKLQNLLFSIVLISGVSINAQNVGINATGAAPVTSAALDVDMVNKGVLLPRVALTSTAVFAPVTGVATQSLLIYNTATAGVAPNNVLPGYYYWDTVTSRWIAMGGSGGRDWSILGNSGTTVGTNFLGTTDNVSLAFKTNNTERMRILNTGNVGIGTTTPGYRLDLNTGTFAFGDGNVRTETRNDAGLQGNAGAQSGFFQTSVPAPAANWPAGAGSWWHLIDSRHSNNANNYALQISGSFFDQFLYYRKTAGSPTTAWNIVAATSNFGTAGQILVSQGANVAPVWQSTNSIIKTYSSFATRTYISGTGWTTVTGLTKSVTTPGPATLVINTYGSLEIVSSAGISGCEIKLIKDGVDVPNAFQTVDISDAAGYSGAISFWSFQTVVNIAAAGTYVFTIQAHEYWTAFDNFYAGGNTTAPAASQNQGALIIMEYDQ